MGKVVGCVLVVIMAACVAPKVVEPQILSTVDVVKPSTNDYLVRVNFALFDEEMKESPKLAKAVQDAIEEWAEALPIECGLYITTNHFLPFDPNKHDLYPGTIKIRMVSLSLPPYSQTPDVLGLWLADRCTLYLNKDLLENDTGIHLIVSLHEIGHVLGVPHVVGEHEITSCTGDIVIKDTDYPQNHVMFPRCGSCNIGAKLSPLEIEVARKNLLNLHQISINDSLRLTD